MQFIKMETFHEIILISTKVRFCNKIWKKCFPPDVEGKQTSDSQNFPQNTILCSGQLYLEPWPEPTKLLDNPGIHKTPQSVAAKPNRRLNSHCKDSLGAQVSASVNLHCCLTLGVWTALSPKPWCDPWGGGSRCASACLPGEASEHNYQVGSHSKSGPGRSFGPVVRALTWDVGNPGSNLSLGYLLFWAGSFLWFWP